MYHKNFLARSLIGILVMLTVAGCGTAGADHKSTVASQACPTAQACPISTTVQIPSGEKRWSQILGRESTIRITFDPGEKCAITTIGVIKSGIIYYNIKVNDQAHATYLVLFQTLDEGKTLKDLQAYPNTAQDAPSWSHSFGENYVGPGTESFNAETFPEGPVYISCFVSQPSGILRILDYGPVEIK